MFSKIDLVVWGVDMASLFTVFALITESCLQDKRGGNAEHVGTGEEGGSAVLANEHQRGVR